MFEERHLMTVALDNAEIKISRPPHVENLVQNVQILPRAMTIEAEFVSSFRQITSQCH